ncbi:hypothetical protein MRX96_019106 [Rhipicephalus microplus]
MRRNHGDDTPSRGQALVSSQGSPWSDETFANAGSARVAGGRGGSQGLALASHGGGCALERSISREPDVILGSGDTSGPLTRPASRPRSSGGSRSGQPANCSAPIKRPPRSLQTRVPLRNTRVHAARFPWGSGCNARDRPRRRPHRTGSGPKLH